MIVSSEDIINPDTKEVLTPYEIVMRIVKVPDDKFFIGVPVYKFSSKHYERGLPSFLTKFKHYTVQTIESALDLEEIFEDLDRPSESSKYRWFCWILRLIIDHLLAPGVTKSPDNADSLLENLRRKHKRNTLIRIDYLSAGSWLAVLLQKTCLKTTLNC